MIFSNLYKNTVIQKPKSTLLILLVLLLSFGYFSKDFQLDASSDTLLLENDPDLKYLREVSKNPQNPDSHYFLGSLYANLGEMQKAKFSFEEALYLDPNHGATIEAISMFMGSQEEKDFGNDLLMYSSKKAPDGPAKHIRMSAGAHEEVRREAAVGDEMVLALEVEASIFKTGLGTSSLAFLVTPSLR